MRTGITLTQHFSFETRQHEFLGLDLGEGVPRRMFMWGFGAVVAWALLMYPLLDIPTKETFTLYFLPPVIFIVVGFRESTKQPRRRNITQWALWVRYWTTGHRPIVAGDARPATRYEYRKDRWSALRAQVRQRVLPARKSRPTWDEEEQQPAPEGPIQTGPPIVLNQRALLLGWDHMQKLRKETAR